MICTKDLEPRELFALVALHGMMAQGFIPNCVSDKAIPKLPGGDIDAMAKWNYARAAVEMADQLIYELSLNHESR